MSGQRTAVLVIHGIGNQRPLGTLRAAADAIYSTDTAFSDRKLWLGMNRDDPDRDLDLPLLTTSNISVDPNTPHYVDFHECYWAHLMAEARFVAVPLWIFELVRKGPRLMAARVRGLWPIIAALFDMWLLAAAYLALSAACLATGWAPQGITASAPVWVAALALAGFTMGRNGLISQLVVLGIWITTHAAVYGAISYPMALRNAGDMWIAVILVATFFAFNIFFLLTIVGDAARYYRAAPGNIKVRRAARKLATDRLRALNEDRRYGRIIVVAHSLGTVIGYDALRAYWSEICLHLGDPGNDADFLAQDRVDSMDPTFDLNAWEARAATLLDRLPDLAAGEERPRWIVSDFVTLGSPLTHAPFLMADGASRAALTASFERKRRERELPQSPAWRVDDDGTIIGRPAGITRRFFHQAGLFGVTRWSNIYFPLYGLVFGDIVGGPITDAFGPGIREYRLPFWRRSPLTAHVTYFDAKNRDATHLRALRAAVRLRP